MMDFELKMEKPKRKQAWISAGALAGSYFAGTSPATANLEVIY